MPEESSASNEPFVHESILGTTFTGRLLRETSVGEYPAVVPTITGQAWIYGTVAVPARSNRPVSERIHRRGPVGNGVTCYHIYGPYPDSEKRR